MSEDNPYEIFYLPLALSLSDLWRACIESGAVPSKALEESTARILAIGDEQFGNNPMIKEIADLIARK